MDLTDLLNGPLGQNVVSSVSSQLGMSKTETTSAIGVAVPAILAGLAKNSQSSKGAESLNKALDSKHDGSLLDNLGNILQNQSSAVQQDGNGILDHIFGANKSAIEKGVAAKSGLSIDKIGPLLSTLAPIVMAFVGQQKKQSKTSAGGLGDLLGGLLGSTGATTSKKSSGGGLMGMVTGMLDKNKDGNVIDDLLGGFLK
ncbi:MAG: DUF937 domain-containing protein [Proteiniphilum sp.]|nr:DUF937 domain-containing protein [Proteiniphilum sp.]